MNYGNGFRFNHILNIFRDVIYEVYNHSKYGYGSGKRERINSYNLEEAYQEFTDELLENILKYQNAELIKEYLYTCFAGRKGSMGVVISIPGNLIVRGFKDAGFLLKLIYRTSCGRGTRPNMKSKLRYNPALPVSYDR